MKFQPMFKKFKIKKTEKEKLVAAVLVLPLVAIDWPRKTKIILE